MRVLFALSGFHRYDRGAEVALLSIARELQGLGFDITVAGGGSARDDADYRYVECRGPRREAFEHFPSFPGFRNETVYEDFFFALSLTRRVPISQFDATVTCAYPYTNWALRRGARGQARHVFVTQNGDWPAISNRAEYRFFDCDRLICTNPVYKERNAAQWNCALIPNGIDIRSFRQATGDRAQLDLPPGPIILMVSALIETKRVLDGIRIVAGLPDATLVVAGDGPLRHEAAKLAQELMPGRFLRLSLASAQMPVLYRSCDTFLHLSETESFGNVYLEAWASGLPIVAHDSANLRWILGDDQFLLDTRDIAATRAAIREALAMPRPYLPEGIERFSWQEVGRQYATVLEELA